MDPSHVGAAAVGSTAAPDLWSAEFLLRAAKDAIVSTPLRQSDDRPAVRISFNELSRDHFNAARERCLAAGCTDMTGQESPPKAPGLYVDRGQMYAHQPPAFEFRIHGIGRNLGTGEVELLRALDLAIESAADFIPRSNEDQVVVSLRVMPDDLEPIVAALERTTGFARGAGYFSSPVCFAAGRTMADGGFPGSITHLTVA